MDFLLGLLGKRECFAKNWWKNEIILHWYYRTLWLIAKINSNSLKCFKNDGIPLHNCNKISRNIVVIAILDRVNFGLLLFFRFAYSLYGGYYSWILLTFSVNRSNATLASSQNRKTVAVSTRFISNIIYSFFDLIKLTHTENINIFTCVK